MPKGVRKKNLYLHCLRHSPVLKCILKGKKVLYTGKYSNYNRHIEKQKHLTLVQTVLFCNF